MRASRLVSIVLLLQGRGQLRAQQLADALEVTVRTIYRDIESVIEAGVPIVGEPGTHGGYHLLEGYRTRLTGLTLEEAQSLSLTGVPGAAAALGLAGTAAAAHFKLMAAINPAARDSAERARQRIHLDPTRGARLATQIHGCLSSTRQCGTTGSSASGTPPRRGVSWSRLSALSARAPTGTWSPAAALITGRTGSPASKT